MDIEVIESIGINNLHPVFGRGLRGETLAASRNRRFVNDLVSAGVRVVIDLRTADHNDKLMKGCVAYPSAEHAYQAHKFPVGSEARVKLMLPLMKLGSRQLKFLSEQSIKSV